MGKFEIQEMQMATKSSHYNDFEPKEMNGEKCHFCNNPATGIVSFYTIYARSNELIPFRDPHKHEFAVCTKDAISVDGFNKINNAALKSRFLNQSSDSNSSLKVISVDFYNKVKPIVLEFYPTISNDEIQEALMTQPDKMSLIDGYELSRKRKNSQTKIRNKLGFYLLSMLILLIAIFFWFNSGFSTNIVGHIIAIIIFGILFLYSFSMFDNLSLRYSQLGKAPNQETAEEVANIFYSELIIDGIGDMSDDSVLLACQLLSSTIVKREKVNSIISLPNAWHEMRDEINKKLHQISNKGPRYRHENIKLVITPLSEFTANVFSEFWHYYIEVTSGGEAGDIEETVAWVITRFHNTAVKIGDKWFLMAGEPGECQVSYPEFYSC